MERRDAEFGALDPHRVLRPADPFPQLAIRHRAR
jgi:hypothetical protein